MYFGRVRRLIVCVSASVDHREETSSSLRFATRAACIKNAPIINKALDAKALYEENLKLKAEIDRLTAMHSGDREEEIRLKLETLDALKTEVAALQRLNEELVLKLERIDNVEGLESMEEEQERLRQNMNELEIELMRERHAKETLQDKLTDIQVLYSEVASQRLFEDASEPEIYVECLCGGEGALQSVTEGIGCVLVIRRNSESMSFRTRSNFGNHYKRTATLLIWCCDIFPRKSSSI